MLKKRFLALAAAASAACLIAACSDSDHSADGAGTARYTVAVNLSEGGQAQPAQLKLNAGQRGEVELTAAHGFRIHSAIGCGGTLSGNLFTTAPASANCTVQVEFIPAGQVSGQLFVAPATGVDASINDTRAALADNGQCARAQSLHPHATVHGFATAAATGGDPAQEHFAEQANPSDFYRVNLALGQTVQLEVADFNAQAQELSLHLWNRDCSQQLSSSSDSRDRHQVSALLGGERVVEVRAKAGASKYVLRVASAWESQDDAEQLAAQSNDMPPLIANEAILTFSPEATAQTPEALSTALHQALGLQLSFRHRDLSRETLVQIEPPADLANMVVSQLSVLDDLQALNPEAFARINTLRVIEFLARQPGVRHAEPNYILETQRTPNDPRYSSQWHYSQIKLPEAWDISTGTRMGGEDVIVAVLDTGVYLAHEDLSAKLVPGYDFHDNDADPDEKTGASSWHGTHVAGTIAASTNNGVGVAGVSWAARIMPVRVLGDQGGSRYAVMQGVRYAAGLVNDSGSLPARRADIINMSLGGGGHSAAEQNLYHAVRERGVLIVAAAGNNNSDQPMYPAAYDGVLSVSATNCRGNRSSYSNHGPTISLAAPGGDSGLCGLNNGGVLSTIGSGSNNSRSSGYGALMGTSMASPHVAGVLALMRAVYPPLTAADVDQLLRDGLLTDDLGEAGRDNDFGHGQINALKAVQTAKALAEGNAEPPARVVASPSVLYMERKSETELELRAEGSGQTPAVTGRQSSAAWLTSAAKDVNEQGLGIYRVLVDRQAFAEDARGEFTGELTFTLSDSSELRVAVHIMVGSAVDAAPIYVMLLNPESREPIYQAPAHWTASGELRYSIDRIVPGAYLIMAGSDIDADGFICQPGETCGAFPAFEAREPITIGVEPVTADFSLDILSRIRPFEGAAEVEPVWRR